MMIIIIIKTTGIIVHCLLSLCRHTQSQSIAVSSSSSNSCI